VDARLAWFFMPGAFKVFLTVPIEVAAHRIMNDPTRNSERYADAVQAVAELRARKASENHRFLEKYNADCTYMGNFSLVIDTSEFTPQQVADQIVTGYRQWAKLSSLPA
jgi:CMP/dCMP kinase